MVGKHDGTPFEEANDWTYFDSIPQATTFDPIGATLFFVAQSNTVAGTDIDNFLVSTDGFVTSTTADSIIDSSTLEDFTGWTKVETGGTVAITSEEGRTFARHVGNGAWGTTGLGRTTPVIAEMGNTIYVNYRGGISNPNSMILMQQLIGISHLPATAAGFYQDGNARNNGWHNHFNTSSDTFSSGAWVNLRFRMDAGGRWILHIHEDDGSPPWLIPEDLWRLSAWTLATYRGIDNYIATNHLEAALDETGDFDEYYFSANSNGPVIAAPPPEDKTGIVIESDLDDLTGWTTTDTGAGSIVTATDSGRDYILITGSGVANETSMVFGTSYEVDLRKVFYIDHKFDGNSTAYIGISATEVSTKVNIVGIGINGTFHRTWDGNNFIGIPLGAVADMWYNLMFIHIPVGNRLHCYRHKANGQSHEEITNWEYFGFVSTPHIVGNNVFVAINVEAADEHCFDNLQVTADGYVGAGPAATVLDSSDIDDYTGWTTVQTTGSNAIVSAGGRTYSKTLGNASWDATGVFRTVRFPGVMGMTFFIDWRGGDISHEMLVFKQDGGIARNALGVMSAAQAATLFFGQNAAQMSQTFPFSSGEWVNVMFRVIAPGAAEIYMHIDNGTPSWELDESDWTWHSISINLDYRITDLGIAVNVLGLTGSGDNERGDIDNYRLQTRFLIAPSELEEGMSVGVRWKDMGRFGLRFPSRGGM